MVPLEKLCNTTPDSKKPFFQYVLSIEGLVKAI